MYHMLPAEVEQGTVSDQHPQVIARASDLIFCLKDPKRLHGILRYALPDAATRGAT